jgi:hypothetical protein
MTLLAAILKNGQDVAVKSDLLRHRRPGEENGDNHPPDHCLYYMVERASACNGCFSARPEDLVVD